MNLLAYRKFGLPPDPWAGLDMDTGDTVRVSHMVAAAVSARAMVSIVGPRGAGKTRAVRRALRAHAGARLVEPLRLQRERMHLGDIETAIVRDLSHEAPRRSGEARSGQVRRLLRAAGRSAVLLIDDAHVLHHATLRGLKRLRELGGADRSATLGVILVGQHDRAERVPEVGLRSDRLTLGGLTAHEAREAIVEVFGRLIEDDAIERLIASPRARNWLDLEAMLDGCLARAESRGLDAVDAFCARDVLIDTNGPASPKAAPAASDAAVRERLRERAA